MYKGVTRHQGINLRIYTLRATVIISNEYHIWTYPTTFPDIHAWEGIKITILWISYESEAHLQKMCQNCKKEVVLGFCIHIRWEAW